MVKMCSLFICLLLVNSALLTTSGQETNSPGRTTIFYSFVINKVPDGFNFPLIGFLNFADGSHASAHIGFINRNQKNFSGLQLSFINTAGGFVKGVQSGFVNATGGSLEGLQNGFVNATEGNIRGLQTGFVNITGSSVNGIQTGFVNINGGKTNGLQTGFVNITASESNGLQTGFVNASARGNNGLQTGFVNISGILNGIQLGFLNFTDSVHKGFPLGFLSFVRKGGYQALELSATESFLFNFSFKTGIKAVYSTVSASWDPFNPEKYALGMGLGSVIPFSPSVYLNPEVTAQGTYPNHHEIYNLTAQIGIALNRKIHFLIGPSLVWLNRESHEEFFDPVFSFYEYQIDDRNKILTGARIALRYILSE